MTTQTASPDQTRPKFSEKGWALIIDDHPLFCDALELTLRSITDFSDFATADDLARGLEVMAGRDAPSLIVLDLNLPDVSGLDGLMRVAKAAANTPIIVVSSLAESAIIACALKAGASGYVPKHSPRAVFQAAIDAIRAGRTYVPDNFVANAVADDSADAVTRLGSLTAQQGRILELICDGKLNKQIAFDLSIAETTVKAHVTAIMRKLGVQSRTQAVLVAQEAKFASILPGSEV